MEHETETAETGLREREGGPLRYHRALGQWVRRGDWAQQQVSSFKLAGEAYLEGRFEDAADLARFTREEAVEAHQIFGAAIERIPAYMRRHGVAPAVVDAEVRQIRDLLALPDGRAFDPERGWRDYGDLIERFAGLCAAREAEGGLDLLERARAGWRRFHDRKCDWVCGLFAAAARHLGESHTIKIWDELIGDMYPGYARFDLDAQPWAESAEQLLHMAVVALRGHLSGPGRMGEVRIVEDDECWRLEFDPCGSGGRTLRADPDEGLPPRVEPPFNHALTTEEHDWAWNRKGVCLYCTHCCQLGQRMPIRMLGYPARVVEPPVWPSADAAPKCAWIIYKDPAKVPEAAYREVGEAKPENLARGMRERD